MRYKFIPLSSLLALSKSKNQIRKLLKTFKCELNPDVETFLHHKAITFEEKGRGRTYLLLDLYSFPPAVMGYYTIAIHSLKIKNLDPETQEELVGERGKGRKWEYIPCYLIGQLGKSDLCLRRGVGGKILKHAIKTIEKGYQIFNGRFILLDAVNDSRVLEFYRTHDFMEIEAITSEKESIKMIYWLVEGE